MTWSSLQTDRPAKLSLSLDTVLDLKESYQMQRVRQMSQKMKDLCPSNASSSDRPDRDEPPIVCFEILRLWNVCSTSAPLHSTGKQASEGWQYNRFLHGQHFTAAHDHATLLQKGDCKCRCIPMCWRLWLPSGRLVQETGSAFCKERMWVYLRAFGMDIIADDVHLGFKGYKLLWIWRRGCEVLWVSYGIIVQC